MDYTSFDLFTFSIEQFIQTEKTEKEIAKICNKLENKYIRS